MIFDTHYRCYEKDRNTIFCKNIGTFDTVHESLQGPGNTKFGPPPGMSRCPIASISVNFKDCMSYIMLESTYHSDRRGFIASLLAQADSQNYVCKDQRMIVEPKEM